VTHSVDTTDHTNDLLDAIEDHAEMYGHEPDLAATRTFQVGHDYDDGFFLEVEQDLDGKLLIQIFEMLERTFGFEPVPDEDNDVVVLDNGNIRIWLQYAEGADD
jgi:hypothetical protein